MRQLKLHTIIYGENIPEVGSQFEKTDCLILAQVNQEGTEVKLLYADGNGKVMRNIAEKQVFTSVKAALQHIATSDRTNGLEVLIVENGIPVDYWFKGGVEDINFVKKVPQLDDIIKEGGVLTKGSTLTFTAESDPNVDDEYFNADDVNAFTLSCGLDGTNVLAMSKHAYTEDSFFYANVVAGNGAMQTATRGWGNVALGAAALNQAKDSTNNIAVGVSALYSFKGEKENFYHSFGGDWGNEHRNIAIGTKAGEHLTEGKHNVLIGFTADWSGSPYELSNKLIIHSSDKDNLSNGNTVPLIKGDFEERWLEVGGKLYLNSRYNRATRDFTDKKYITAADSEGLLTKVDKVNFIKDILLSDSFTLTEEEQATLKTKLGL